ncbi:22219_t:CDS:1, partial [Gigaspora rosea]
ATTKKKELEKELNELQDMARITTNPEYCRNFFSQISDVKKSIKNQNIQLENLRRHAASQRKSQEKKIT